MDVEIFSTVGGMTMCIFIFDDERIKIIMELCIVSDNT